MINFVNILKAKTLIGIFYISFMIPQYVLAQNKESSKSLFMSVPTYYLHSTSYKPLSFGFKTGMTVYNSNPDITGSIVYPSIGKGLYTFDGTGWLVSKIQEIPVLKNEEKAPLLSNVVVLINEGTFIPTNAADETGRYYYIRNTSTENRVFVSNVIDFSKNVPDTIRLSAKEGGMMIYSDGTNWYRIN